MVTRNAYLCIDGNYSQLRAYTDAIGSDVADLASMLRSYLVTRLPEYMVPAAHVLMDAFPLTPNGKLDRKALTFPGDNAFAAQAYEEPNGKIEYILSSIWAELPHVERVGRHGGFFALGGYSLTAVKMIGRIRSMLGFDISLYTLFEAPTIAELVPRLLAAGATQAESYNVLLPIKPQGSRPPLFCVHPGTGLSWRYTGLSTRLDPDQPFFGLQARGFLDDGKMASTFDEMVIDCIDQVRRIQPQGPYQLLGYSFGGMVAHTMNACLEKQGERVALVALMDTSVDYHSRERRAPAEDGNVEKPDLVAFLDRSRMILLNNIRIGGAQAPSVIKANVLIFRSRKAVVAG